MPEDASRFRLLAAQRAADAQTIGEDGKIEEYGGYGEKAGGLIGTLIGAYFGGPAGAKIGGQAGMKTGGGLGRAVGGDRDGVKDAFVPTAEDMTGGVQMFAGGIKGMSEEEKAAKLRLEAAKKAKGGF